MARQWREQMQGGPHGGGNDNQNEGGIGRQVKGGGKAAIGKSKPEDRKAKKGKNRRFRHALADMPELIVPELMGKDGQDFVGSMVSQKRVEKDDALGPAKSGKISIAMRR